jgi:site-specific recombinase XerD
MKRPFRSCLAKQFEEFVYSKRASKRWSQSYEENLHFFDNYCANRFPNASSLTEGMLEWCNERLTEKGNSCKYRITVVSNFVKYARNRGWTEIEPPKSAFRKAMYLYPSRFYER